MIEKCRWAVALAVILTTGSAPAQPEPQPAPPPQAPDPEPGPSPRPDPLKVALAPQRGGMTLASVGDRAVKTSFSVAVKRAELEEAAAALDRAFVAYFPTLTLTASYTRLSPVDNVISSGPGQPAIAIPTVLNNYALGVGLLVPISDYLLRLSQTYGSAEKASAAKRIETRAEQLKVAADAKVALLEWVRARGQLVVAKMAVVQSEAHVAQTKTLLEVGTASRADLLRLEAQLANAEHLERAAGVLVAAAAKQLRTVLHLAPNAPLTSALDVMSPPQDERRSEEDLERLALRQRLELEALDETARSLDEADTSAHAGYYPRLDAFGNALLASPNPRVFSQTKEFDLTWDVGLRLTWVINESFSTAGATAATRSRIDATKQQSNVLRDAIRLEVSRAYFDGARARSAIIAADKSEVALEAALKAWLDRYNVGKAKSTDIVDAETELTRVRLERINAHIDVLVAKVRLDYAIGAGVR